ncbi:MAG: GH92 family glycosyl hydrolase [Schleiferiaceae bacterium]
MTRTLLFASALCATSAAWSQISVADIDPFIGTGGHGHTHPSATAPFGMVQIGPDTRRDGWDGCSGYHFTDSTVWGFSHTHLSGTGVGDYGDFLFKPWGSTFQDAPVAFRKSSESASAGYYGVTLASGTRAEFTAAERGGFHRYTFAPGQPAVAWIDLNYRDRVLRSKVIQFGETLILQRVSQGWAREQHAYLAVQLPAGTRVEVQDSLHVLLRFASPDVAFAVGFSGTGPEGAQRNLLATLKSAPSFAACAARTQQLWGAELDRAQVTGGSATDRRIYATALYHAFSVPNLWSDVDGRYRGMDGKIHDDPDRSHYTVFSLWDTYRTAHPLYALVQPERTNDFIASMLDMYDQSGRLPVWELAGNETNCMIGYHSVSVLADAHAKGYAVDGARMLRAMVATANAPVFGLPDYRANGYLSIQDESESVSKTLEYSYDDATISWTASRLGEPAIAAEFWRRSQGWVSLLDPETGLMRPRDNGDFMARYEPREVNNHFTEANAWQYSFAPVHDLPRWKRMLAAQGRSLEGQLDALFAAPSATVGRDQADITGLIGQYAHGNEPSHHIAWLYAATDRSDKGHARIREILATMYSDQPDGYQGNEDCGQMSAWYVMSSWGLYPLVPGEARYAVGPMLWDRVALRSQGLATDVIRVGEGSEFTGYQIGGDAARAWSYLDHQDLLRGESIRMNHGPQAVALKPYENVDVRTSPEVLPAPRVQVPRRFEGRTTALIDGKPKAVTHSEVVVVGDGITTHRAIARTTKKPHDWTAQITHGQPNPQYHPGDASLVDGVRGDVDWRKGEWTGIQGQDLVVELRPARVKRLKELHLKVTLLKDIKSWIALPDSVQLWVVLDDGTEWLAAESAWAEAKTDEPSYIASWATSYRAETAREGRIAALRFRFSNPGALPDWHPGAGGETFIFVDELELSTK